MNRLEVEQIVRSTLRRSAELPSDPDFPLDRPLAETGLDSLALVAFLTALEKRFGLAFDDAVWVERGQFTTSYFVDRICAENGAVEAAPTVNGVPAAADPVSVDEATTSETPGRSSSVAGDVDGDDSYSDVYGAPHQPSFPARLWRAFSRRLASATKSIIRRQTHYFLVRQLDHTLPPPKSDLPVEFREMSAAEFAPINPSWGCSQRNLERWVREGFFCLTGWHEGRLATFDWLAPEGDTEALTGLEIRTRPGSCFALGLFENPEFAGKGVGLAMAAYSLHVARARGFIRQTTMVEASNAPMLLASVQILGFRKVGTVRTVAWFNRPRSTWTLEGAAGRARVVVF